MSQDVLLWEMTTSSSMGVTGNRGEVSPEQLDDCSSPLYWNGCMSQITRGSDAIPSSLCAATSNYWCFWGRTSTDSACPVGHVSAAQPAGCESPWSAAAPFNPAETNLRRRIKHTSWFGGAVAYFSQSDTLC